MEKVLKIGSLFLQLRNDLPEAAQCTFQVLCPQRDLLLFIKRVNKKQPVFFNRTNVFSKEGEYIGMVRTYNYNAHKKE